MSLFIENLKKSKDDFESIKYFIIDNACEFIISFDDAQREYDLEGIPVTFKSVYGKTNDLVDVLSFKEF